MATLEEVEREIARRGLRRGSPKLDEVEREIARRGLAQEGQGSEGAQSSAPIDTGAQAAGAVAQPPPAPAANPPGQVSELSSQASKPISGPTIPSLTDFGGIQRGAEAMVEGTPEIQRALPMLGLLGQLGNLQKAVGGRRGATIAGAEGAGRLGGAALGGALGGPPGAVAGGIAGGAFGAGAGAFLDRLSKGEQVTAGEVALEAGFSAVPDALVNVVRQGIRGGQRLLTRTARGVRESENLAAQHLRARAETILKPPDKADVDRLFELVRASGDKLSPSSLAKDMRDLTKTQWAQIGQVIRKIPAPPGSQITDFGEAAERVFTRIRNGQPAPGLDLGALQHLRSQVQMAKMARQDGALKDSLQLFQDSIDSAILTGKFMRGGGFRPMLFQAREGFRKLKETEELSELMFSVTGIAKDRSRLKVDLGKLTDALDKPKRGVQQKAVAAINRQPGAMAELRTFLKNMDNVDITPGPIAAMTGGMGQMFTIFGAAGSLAGDAEVTALGMTGAAMQLLGLTLSRPASRAQFTALVLKNQARTGARMITLPELSMLANMARRSSFGAEENRQ